MANTYDGSLIVAGSILKYNGQYQGVISVVLGSNIWLTEPADTAEDIDFGSRKHLLSENTIQLRKYELIEETNN